MRIVGEWGFSCGYAGDRGKFPGAAHSVMAGLVPAIHAVMSQQSLPTSSIGQGDVLTKQSFGEFFSNLATVRERRTAWVAGTSPAMTNCPVYIAPSLIDP
jgi:hypothetical protein